MKTKFHVVPGEVRSKNDRDVHFIEGPHLAELYGLKKGEWINCPGETCHNLDTQHLHPLYNGNYRRP